MAITKPIPFAQALQSLKDKKALPNNLSTAELRQLAGQITRNSLLSARTNNEWYIEKIRATVLNVLNPQPQFDPAVGREVTKGFNQADARLELKRALEAIDYIPEEGKEGGLQDLSSDRRLNLILRTQTTQAQSVGTLRKLQDPNLLAVAPALELVRFESREEPRDWLARFMLAGHLTGRSPGDGWTVTPDRRMIALVNDPIWDELGNPDNFEDAIGPNFPPFAFNSGMGWQSVDIDEAEELGLMNSGPPAPENVGLEEPA